MKRSAAKTHHAGTVAQVLLVAVLLLAVVWQVDGAHRHQVAEREADSPAPVAPIDEPAKPYITTDDVNVRRGPGTDHEILTVMPLHAEVMVTGAGQNGFVPVKVDGTSAWIAADFVVPKGSVLGGTTADVPVIEEPEPTEAPPIPTEVSTLLDPEPTEAPPVPTEVPVVVAEETAPPPADAGFAEAFAPEVSAAEPGPTEAPVVAGTYEEAVPGLPLTGEGERWVDVNRTTGIVTLYEGERIVAEFEALIGKDPSPDGFYSTATGTFQVHMMNRELTETPFAEGVYLTHFVGFDWERSNGFHSPTRDAEGNVIQTGGTSTLGCVRLGAVEAAQLYDFAYIGMRVEIHD